MTIGCGDAAATKKDCCYATVDAKGLPCGLGATAGDAEASRPSNVVTFDGQPSTSVSILQGLTVTVDGVVVEEFHKPFTAHQDATVCTEVTPPGVVVVVETILTPRRP